MKFLIQKINGEIRHDFAFTLLESIRFKKWLSPENKIVVKFANTFEITDPDMIYPMPFKDHHKDYVPVGSVDFVTDFLMYFYNIYPKPINVPEVFINHQSYDFTMRKIFNGTHDDLRNRSGRWFVKSNDVIKKFAEVLNFDNNHIGAIPRGNYQISEFISIESEWRCFVYQGKLVGLQNYSGEFTMFPNVDKIKEMIRAYIDAPIAYTLDVGINNAGTFVIECHEFFSIGHYSFNSQHYPNMLYRGFKEFLNKNL